MQTFILSALFLAFAPVIIVRRPIFRSRMDEVTMYVLRMMTFQSLGKPKYVLLFSFQLGAMFDTIQRSSLLSSDWATLLFQLVSSGTVTADSLPTKK